MRYWKVGELAKRTGVTVRTLHHYDEVGLLSPSTRNGSGYRLYADEDIRRLQQIVSLRQIGFTLEEIAGYLSSPDASPLRVVEMHLARLGEQIEVQQRLRKRLEALAKRLHSAESISTEEFIRTVEATTMFDKYYTPEQLQQLEERRVAMGEDAIRKGERDWSELMAEVRAEMDKGTDPSDPRVRALADRWSALVRGFTGGDPGIEKSLQSMWTQESNIAGMEVGPIREMGDYLRKGEG